MYVNPALPDHVSGRQHSGFELRISPVPAGIRIYSADIGPASVPGRSASASDSSFAPIVKIRTTQLQPVCAPDE